jgi:predicted lipoprotein with Yx(FWY)xxD motif
MTNTRTRMALVAAALMLAATGALAAPLAAKNGMTVYTYDKDKGAVPSCYGLCAYAWPPYLGKKGEKMGADWSLVARKGALQWAWHKHPVYFYVGDHKKGDTSGNGKDGVWHIIKK